MEVEVKDLVLLVSILSTIISMYYAIKYRTEKNTDDTKTNKDSLKKFKDFVHTEIEELKNDLNKVNLNITELLRKDEAEEKYLSRKEHQLSYENLNMKIDLILEAVKNKKD